MARVKLVLFAMALLGDLWVLELGRDGVRMEYVCLTFYHYLLSEGAGLTRGELDQPARVSGAVELRIRES